MEPRVRAIHYTLIGLVFAVLAVAATLGSEQPVAGFGLSVLAVVAVLGSLLTVRRGATDTGDRGQG